MATLHIPLRRRLVCDSQPTERPVDNNIHMPAEGLSELDQGEPALAPEADPEKEPKKVDIVSQGEAQALRDLASMAGKPEPTIIEVASTEDPSWTQQPEIQEVLKDGEVTVWASGSADLDENEASARKHAAAAKTAGASRVNIAKPPQQYASLANWNAHAQKAQQQALKPPEPPKASPEPTAAVGLGKSR